MMATRLRRGIDMYGLVHYNSGAKRTYIWPLCSTPYLAVEAIEATDRRVVTCLLCIVTCDELS